MLCVFVCVHVCMYVYEHMHLSFGVPVFFFLFYHFH